MKVDGTDFKKSYKTMGQVIRNVRMNRHPWIVHAKVSLLNHHTSGVRKEFYRTEEDLAKHAKNDPLPKLREVLLGKGIHEEILTQLEEKVKIDVTEDFDKAVKAPEPDPLTVTDHIFVPTSAIEEEGEREPTGREKIVMVDAALFAIREIMEDDPNSIFFGQDVGRRLGGVFREAATLAEQFGDHRVFNTA